MNISHRDIKPENFVFENKVSDNIKLIDFGLSSNFISINESKRKELLLRMRTPVGTKLYVAPEVYKKEYTEKCDIWSAGVMLFAMLCGYPPFIHTDDEVLKRKILKMKVKFDPDDWVNISSEAQDLISRMLVPEDRRLSAKECLDHPWFELDANILSSKIISMATFDRLKSYSKSTLFRQIVQYIIAYRCELLEDDVERFRKLYLKIDQDNQGYITYENCKEYFSSVFKEESQMRNFFDALDLDGNGKVHWNEFLSCMITQNIFKRDDNLYEVFSFFDRDNKGYFTSDDFKTAIGDQYLSFGGSHANFANVIEEAFPGKAKITFDDLRMFMH